MATLDDVRHQPGEEGETGLGNSGRYDTVPG
jgi:hypothetical protein